MKNVKSLMVFGQKYKVVYKDIVSDDNGITICGRCNTQKKEIEINEQLSGGDLLLTMLHEYMHSTLYETSVSPVLDSKIEEILVDLLAKSAILFFKQIN